MVDNFDRIRKFLDFGDKDLFYFVQVIKRRKDPGNESMVVSDSVIKSYYVSSLEYFDRKASEMKKLSEVFNARVYINLSRRSFKGVALSNLCNMAELISKEAYYSIGNSYNMACGDTGIDKLRLIDIDSNHIGDIGEIREMVKDFIKIEVPTISGVHIICSPFNPIQLRNKFSDIDIHKNDPTLLYYGL